MQTSKKKAIDRTCEEKKQCLKFFKDGSLCLNYFLSLSEKQKYKTQKKKKNLPLHQAKQQWKRIVWEKLN